MAPTLAETGKGARVDGGGALLFDALPGLVFAGVLLAVFLFYIDTDVLRGGLIDTDSYMHGVRLRDVLAHGGWNGGFLLRDNAPYGMVLHWSKAYDLIVLALAWPLAALAGWNAALAAVLPAIGPLSIAALIFAALWAVRPQSDENERRYLGVALALTPLVVNYGLIGAATYHVLILAVWALFMGFVLRAAQPPHRLSHGIAAGLTAAFALWLAVECVLALALGMLVLGLAWIRHGRDLRRTSLGLAFTLAIALAALLAFDPPYGGWREPWLERLSIVYVVFGLLVALLSVVMAAAPQTPRAWRARLAVAAVGTLLSAAALATLFPELLSPDRAIFGAELYAEVWSKINEGRPAFENASRGILLTGGPAIGFVAALAFALSQRGARAAWSLVAAMLAIMTVPGLVHARFCIYPEVLAALPIAALLARPGAVAERVLPRLLRPLGRAFMASVILVGPPLSSGMLLIVRGVAAEPLVDCRVRHVAWALNDVAFMGARNLIIMTEWSEAPATLYWTNHRVVAGPYHRDVEGLRDAVAFMTGKDDRQSRAILTRRGVSYVMICGQPPKKGAPAKAGEADLEDRLARGEAPSWLTPVPWPIGLVSDLRLFRVEPPPAPN